MVKVITALTLPTPNLENKPENKILSSYFYTPLNPLPKKTPKNLTYYQKSVYFMFLKSKAETQFYLSKGSIQRHYWFLACYEVSLSQMTRVHLHESFSHQEVKFFSNVITIGGSGSK